MAGSCPVDLSDVPVTDRFNLSDRHYLVTGGGRGIGFACAKAIAQLGGGVAVIDALPEPTDEFWTLSRRYGVKTSYIQGDVTDQTSLEEAFTRSVAAVGGRLHGGLIAAGICVDQPLLEATWEASQQTFNVNVMGLYWTVKLLAGHLVETKTDGSIVTIASVNGQGMYVPAQPCSSYNASKAAVKGLVGPLAGELGQYGIRINSISPGRCLNPIVGGRIQLSVLQGAIQTPLLKRLESSPEKRAILDFYRHGAPLGRLGTPEDLTPMVTYLLSDAASFTTGGDFLVTGESALIPNVFFFWL